MTDKIPFTYYNRGLILISLLFLMNIAKGFVKVEAPEDYLLVPQNSNVNLTCLFTDDQGAGIDKVNVSWRLIDKDRKIEEGIETSWNVTHQVGISNLQITNVSTEYDGDYNCVVLINGSFDYKKIKLQTFNTTQSKIENKVHIIPKDKQVSICNGPPLRINCTFKFDDKCDQSVKVDWWKLNTTSQTWDRQVDGASWWSNEWGGKGWLNFSNTNIEEDMFICAVKCGSSGNFGTRRISVKSQTNGEKIKTRYNTYPSVENMDVLMSCNIEKYLYTDYGWWFNGSKLYNGEKYNIQSKDRTMELIVKKVSNEDVGNFTCWVAKDDWWDAASVTLSITKESY